MAKYGVMIPVAGHVYVELEASSEEDAIERGLNAKWSWDDIQQIESLHSFTTGNVCHCPSPWDAEATLLDDEGSA